MKRTPTLIVVFFTAVLLFPIFSATAQTVSFEPVGVPSLGPEDARVTIIEIVDYM